MGRLAIASSRPGNDPRMWLGVGRVDNDQDAIRWDANLGWLVDITFATGQLAGEGPYTCRVSQAWAGDGEGDFDPPTLGSAVAISIMEGTPTASLWIIGPAADPDFPPPTSVNGQDIDEDFAKANHVRVSTHSLQAQYGSKWRTSATDRATLEAPKVQLQSDDADQPYVRGTAYADALGTFLDALLVVFVAVGTFATAVGSAIPALVVPAQTLNTAISTAFQAQLTQFKNARQQYLSTKINGD